MTGSLSDRLGRRGMITDGMWVQAIGLMVTVATDSFGW